MARVVQLALCRGLGSEIGEPTGVVGLVVHPPPSSSSGFKFESTISPSCNLHTFV